MLGLDGIWEFWISLYRFEARMFAHPGYNFLRLPCFGCQPLQDHVCQVSVFSPPARVHWAVHCSWVKLHRHAFLVDFPTWRICTLQDKPFPDWTENLTGLHKKWQTCYSCKSFPRKMAKNTPPQCAVRLNTLLLKKILENLAVLPRIYLRNVSPVETSF